MTCPINGSPIDPLDGLVFAAWRTNSTLMGASTADGMNRIAGYDLESRRMEATSTTFPVDRSLASQGNWKCFERSSCTAITFDSKERLWVEIREITDDDTFPSEVWTIDKDTMQRIEPTFNLNWLRTGSGSADGSRIVVAVAEGERELQGIRVIDGRTGAELTRIGAAQLGTTRPVSAAITQGGLLVASSFEGDLTIYDLETRKVLHALSGALGGDPCNCAPP